jgi:hypothetical protein
MTKPGINLTRLFISFVTCALGEYARVFAIVKLRRIFEGKAKSLPEVCHLHTGRIRSYSIILF